MIELQDNFYRDFRMSDLLAILRRCWTVLAVPNHPDLLVRVAEAHIAAIEHELIRRCPEPDLARWAEA